MGRTRSLLELGGIVVLAVALGIALYVEMHVFRAVRSNGEDGEDQDYKIRTEARHLESMKKGVDEQEVILAQLREAREVQEKEKRDVWAMHHHENPAQGSATDSDAQSQTSFQNPLNLPDADGDHE